MKTKILLLLVFLSFINCKDAVEEESASVKACEVSEISLPDKYKKEEVYDAAAAVATEAPVEASAESNSGATNSIPIEPKIIKEGNLRFETNNLEPTYQKILNAVKSQNATIQNDVEGKDYQSIFRNVVVRIPSKNFDAFIKEISTGVNYFDKKEISASDVTEEYIDVDARLKAKKILEARYFELLKKANKVSEMIEIETQLAAIREEIDAKEGQLRYMKSRISMSTITIEFYKTVAEESGATVSFWSKIWNAIASGFNNISNFFIGIVQLWPFIAIFVLAFYFIRKRFKKKHQS